VKLGERHTHTERDRETGGQRDREKERQRQKEMEQQGGELKREDTRFVKKRPI